MVADSPSAVAAPEQVTLPLRSGDRACALLHAAPTADVAGLALLLPADAWGATRPGSTASIISTAANLGLSVLELEPPQAAAPTRAVTHAAATAAVAFLRTRGARGRAGRVRVGAIGEGTGANVAAALGAEFDAVLLLSGIYDIPRAVGAGRGIDVADVQTLLGTQFLRLAADPAVSPARADLAGFPPAYLLAEDRGPACAQTLAMTDALAKASSPTTCALWSAATSTAAAETARGLAWLVRTLADPPPRIGDPGHPVTVALAGPAG